jgi:hypothetical protein
MMNYWEPYGNINKIERGGFMLVFPNFSRYINYDNFSNNDSHTLVFEEKSMAWWLRLSIMFEVQASNLSMDTSFSQMDFI